jgi:hypothetical protein
MPLIPIIFWGGSALFAVLTIKSASDNVGESLSDTAVKYAPFVVGGVGAYVVVKAVT